SNVAMPNVRPESQQRPSAPEMSHGNVPHPPSAGMNRGEGPSGGGAPRGMGQPSTQRPSNPTPRSESNNSRGGVTRGGPRSEMSVPRPTGASAPRGYSSAGERDSFPSANNGRKQSPRPAPSYEADRKPSPNFGGGPN